MSETEVLILSEFAAWPLDHGGRLRVAYLARSLERLGVSVKIASPEGVAAGTPEDLRRLTVGWPDRVSEEVAREFLRGWGGVLGPVRRRLARHQGIEAGCYGGALELVRRLRPRAVIGVGQHAPLMLHGLPRGLTRIWYAADDVVAFLLSCVRRESVTRWPSRMYETLLHAGLEVGFGGLDGIVGVSEGDLRFLSMLGRPRVGRVIPNGVDLEVFRPERGCAVEPKSAVFWGRLDFEPNVDGLLWFVKRVWPELRSLHGGARFRVVGRGMHRSLERLGEVEGVELVGAVDDVRPYAWGSSVTVLPMRCGGGIKNKLLEALAMGRPVACTDRALTGLPTDHRMPPVRLGRDAEGLVSAMDRLWGNPATAAHLGHQARSWAERHAGWDRAGAGFMGMIEDCERAAGRDGGRARLARAA
ncbi:glycosyltransferase family 4 protein [Mucisphaera calidilacus]|uniref:Glycosyltransferase n=1 Tax=Mucisphaera calidilacus TaxID=2527982 RepID=A0A518BXW5_9BACT|nr:glycosyltransferase family 4 protein [Mucisphaera calidilacus]QDU71794.1 hypothetical protein Pan265_16470 [Mucisphaera calidilacus]